MASSEPRCFHRLLFDEYSLTTVQRSTNRDAIVRVSESYSIKTSSCAARLWCPTASPIRYSNDRSILTDSGPMI